MAKVLAATPNEKGEYETPLVKIIPGKTYTYTGLYKVEIGEKLIRVGLTRAEKGKAERIPVTPDKTFLENLAKRFSGSLTKNIIEIP